MGVSSKRPPMTAGLDLGDRYSYLCLVDQHSGEVIEEGRLRTTAEAIRRRFASERPPMRTLWGRILPPNRRGCGSP